MTRNGAAMRSIRALTIGSIIASDRRRQLDRDEAMQELDQQFQLPISGVATAVPVWQDVEIAFDVTLLDAPDMRETPYSEPLVTHGVFCADDVFVTVAVAAWIRDEQQNFAGARVRIGVVAFFEDPVLMPTFTAQAVAPVETTRRFRGDIHLNFSGFGSPDFPDNTED